MKILLFNNLNLYWDDMELQSVKSSNNLIRLGKGLDLFEIFCPSLHVSFPKVLILNNYYYSVLFPN